MRNGPVDRIAVRLTRHFHRLLFATVEIADVGRCVGAVPLSLFVIDTCSNQLVAVRRIEPRVMHHAGRILESDHATPVGARNLAVKLHRRPAVSGCARCRGLRGGLGRHLRLHHRNLRRDLHVRDYRDGKVDLDRRAFQLAGGRVRLRAGRRVLADFDMGDRRFDGDFVPLDDLVDHERRRARHDRWGRDLLGRHVDAVERIGTRHHAVRSARCRFLLAVGKAFGDIHDTARHLGVLVLADVGARQACTTLADFLHSEALVGERVLGGRHIADSLAVLRIVQALFHPDRIVGVNPLRRVLCESAERQGGHHERDGDFLQLVHVGLLGRKVD